MSPLPQVIVAALSFAVANAYPSAMLEAAARDPSLIAKAEQYSREYAKRQGSAGAASAIFEPVPIFNAEAQYVNVSKGSGHEYVAPKSSDLRGPCPGLNAFANHGEFFEY